MHPAIIIGTVRSLIVDVAMGQIPRSTERISSLGKNQSDTPKTPCPRPYLRYSPGWLPDTLTISYTPGVRNPDPNPGSNHNPNP